VPIQDERFYHLNLRGGPTNVPAELRVGGTLDRERLADAVRTAMARHPITRGYVTSNGGGLEWEIPEDFDRVPIEVVDCPDDAALTEARERTLSRPVPLDRPPPFWLTLARHPDGDALILAIHHMASDGLGSFRFLTSICRAYAGVPDPLPDLDPLWARDPLAIGDVRSLRNRWRRTRGRLRRLDKSREIPTQLAPAQGAAGMSGAGLQDLWLGEAELTRLLSRRREIGSFNDTLLAGLAVGMRRWNDQRGQPPASMLMIFPLNLRPPEWPDQLVANLSTMSTVTVPQEAQLDVESAQRAIAPQTAELKRQRYAAVPREGWLPKQFKQMVKKTIRSAPPDVDGAPPFTACFSNLGTTPELPSLGDAGGDVVALWAPAPVRAPSSPLICTTTTGGRMVMSMCYDRAMLGDAAEGFLSCVRDALLDRP
jgi:NRPS condensation-like uncharacterized protein